jgi:zona occludens toxin (predicted ATPase)
LLEGKKVQEVELLDLFPAEEGMIAQYYGRIGGGKTYAATADILELLRRGKVVYANWRLHYEGTDERKSVAHALASIIFPWKKRFYNFPPENLIFFELSDKWAQDNGYNDFTHWLATRTDCYIFADEGHIMFDSYAGIRMSIEKRASIYHTRHFNRNIFIISQRPTAIHVSMRANVSVFYRCERIWKFGGIVRFKRTEFQDILNESVDEDEEKIIDVKYYWGKSAVFEAYDSKYLRGDTAKSQNLLFSAYDFGYLSRFYLFGHDLLMWLDSKLPRRGKG